ncbi:DUF4142 domain-containing protein [Streptomyces sp. NPDC003077]|uniref:DUF4142 domain-containing protein n=1 Tax=Streptomyces sp. NPDC003077 TaxID=3154443 RepID=UPI0033BDA75A
MISVRRAAATTTLLAAMTGMSAPAAVALGGGGPTGEATPEATSASTVGATAGVTVDPPVGEMPEAAVGEVPEAPVGGMPDPAVGEMPEAAVEATPDPTSPSDPNGTSPSDPNGTSPSDPNGTSPSDPNGTSPSDPNGTSPSDPNGTSPSDPDATFLRAVHQGNLAEIAAGQDADQNATTSCVRKVGAMLVRDHTKLDADAKALANRLNVALPSAPSQEQQDALVAVQAQAGTPEYDGEWLTAQATAHTETLALIDQAIRTGRNAEVRAAAHTARPVVAMHLEAVRGGTCREGASAGTIPTGTGGQLATADPAAVGHRGALALAGGGAVVAVGGVLWLRRARRRASGR